MTTVSNQTPGTGTTQLQPQPNGAVAKSAKPVDVLKGMLNAPSVQEQFKNALGKSSNTFVASIIDLYNGDPKMQQCKPKQVVMEALKAAVLHLPINKALGYAYIIPYNNTHKDPATGRFFKVMEPTFQMGYKGYIQLAQRTGQYRTINADVVYEGELNRVNKLTGEISFDGERKSDKVVGYFCYFQLLNGFSKTLYMTVEEMARHAKIYSKDIKKETSVDTLMNLANLPVNMDSKQVGWMGNFHSMAVKTVIRQLLSKYGYLSIEMQTAIANDYQGEDIEDKRDEVVSSEGNSKALSFEDATFVDVTDQPAEQQGTAAQGSSEPVEEDPGY